MGRGVRQVWMVGLALAPSCSSDGGSDARAPTFEQACAELASARCEDIESCTPYTFAINFPDRATCRERLAAGCMRDRTAPGSTVTPEDLRACAARLAVDACEDSFEAPHPECTMPRGTLADGATCLSWDQCAGGYCDKSGSTNGCGLCTELGELGDVCSGQLPCDTGLVCFNGQCARAHYLGESCDEITPCAGGMRCVSGRCSEPGLPGESCSETAWCSFGRGAHCDSALAACVERVPVPLGQSCDPAQGYFCAAPGFCAGGTCTANLVGEGETCNDQGRCEPPYTCIEGVCIEITADVCSDS